MKTFKDYQTEHRAKGENAEQVVATRWVFESIGRMLNDLAAAHESLKLEVQTLRSEVEGLKEQIYVKKSFGNSPVQELSLCCQSPVRCIGDEYYEPEKVACRKRNKECRTIYTPVADIKDEAWWWWRW